jgi:twitching motility protein PilT
VLDADKTPLIRDVVAEGVTQYGMQTFDQSVMWLLKEGLITEEEALRNATNSNELALKLKGISGTSDRVWQPVDDGKLAGVKSAPSTPGGSGSTPAQPGAGGKPGWMSSD